MQRRKQVWLLTGPELTHLDTPRLAISAFTPPYGECSAAWEVELSWVLAVCPQMSHSTSLNLLAQVSLLGLTSVQMCLWALLDLSFSIGTLCVASH